MYLHVSPEKSLCQRLLLFGSERFLARDIAPVKDPRTLPRVRTRVRDGALVTACTWRVSLQLVAWPIRHAHTGLCAAKRTILLGRALPPGPPAASQQPLLSTAFRPTGRG